MVLLLVPMLVLLVVLVLLQLLQLLLNGNHTASATTCCLNNCGYNY